MATIQEKITALKESLAAGTETVSIGDRTIKYRSVADIQTILSGLEKELALESGTESSPFGILNITYTKGL